MGREGRGEGREEGGGEEKERGREERRREGRGKGRREGRKEERGRRRGGGGYSMPSYTVRLHTEHCTILHMTLECLPAGAEET